MEYRLADNFLHFKEPVVVITKADLNRLTAVYNAAAEWVEIIKCGKCGEYHNRNYRCPACSNDPDNEEFPCEIPDLNITILDSTY